ncbi:MAG TPA: abortive phage infection protein [Clostridiaceae bacterium]|nr:abortive phage infection protein [Clostridiaceae bacterium]
MTYSDKLRKLLNQHGGTITTKEASEAGISKEMLRLLTNAGEVERVAQGVYISQEAFLDKMYVLQKRLSTIIYSHETALFLHDLTDRDPIRYAVTLPSNVRSKRLKDENIRVFYIKRELHDVGVTTMQTVFGNNVFAYGLERTICDCIRSRNQMDIAIVADAMKRYAKRSDKDLNLLMSFADQFRISNVINRYLEVLL